MATASEYHRLYVKWKDEQKKYNGWIDKIEAIEKKFNSSPVSKDPGQVNKVLKKAVTLHHEALKGRAQFNTNADLLEKAKEKEVLSDSNMYSADAALLKELNRLRRLRDEAEINKKKYYNLYVEALKKEAGAVIGKAAKAVVTTVTAK